MKTTFFLAAEAYIVMLYSGVVFFWIQRVEKQSDECIYIYIRPMKIPETYLHLYEYHVFTHVPCNAIGYKHRDVFDVM